MTLRLYDLAGADPNRRFSPYCWRIRLALAHKRLPVETIPWRFTEKAEIAPSGSKTVPVIVDGDRWIANSWTIANYLEDTYPGFAVSVRRRRGAALDAPLFEPRRRSGRPRSFPLSHSISWSALPTGIVSIFAPVVNSVSARRWRLSSPTATPGLPGFRASLAPLRATLKTQPFFGGDEPLYADYAVFGQFQWARCISPFALLEEGDPVKLWRDRLLDCFDGLARKAVAYDV